MQLLNNVAVGDAYTEATTLGPVPTCEKVVFLVANNSVVVQLAGSNKAKTVEPWSDEVLVTPQSAEFQRIQGIRFRNAIPGSVARVVAMLITPDDPVPVGGTPFEGVLAASGGITTLQSLTGRINANGTIAAGTGFSCARGAAGQYAITFTTPFSSPPLVLVQLEEAIVQQENTINLAGVPITTGFNVQTALDNTGTGGGRNFRDAPWSFLAQPIS